MRAARFSLPALAPPPQPDRKLSRANSSGFLRFRIHSFALFLRVETDIFEEQNITGLQCSCFINGLRPNTIVREIHRAADFFTQSSGNRF